VTSLQNEEYKLVLFSSINSRMLRSHGISWHIWFRRGAAASAAAIAMTLDKWWTVAMQ